MTAEITSVMAALKTAVATAYASRVVTRDLLDFDDRPEADLKKGIYTLIAGKEGNFPNYLGREGNFGALQLIVIGQIKVDEKHPADSGPVPHEIEDAENGMIDEIKAFTRSAPAAPIDEIILKTVRRSQQLEYPYGWVTFEMELQLS